MQPVCTSCQRVIPEGVARLVFEDGFAICGPCLWDGATPRWRAHQQHDEPHATCAACGVPASVRAAWDQDAGAEEG